MALIINEKVIPCKVFVSDWNVHGMQFRPYKGCRPRAQNISLVVLHWTGGESSAEKFYQNIKARGLGIEFYIDRNGRIYQFCDPSFVDTFDAGRFNARSVGIEIANYGFRWKSHRLAHKLLAPRIARDRDLYETILRRRKRVFADFYPIQKLSLFHLLESLCDALNIPPKIPKDGSANPIIETLSFEASEMFHGICGHYHLSKRKSDPGTRLLEEVSYHFDNSDDITPVEKPEIRAKK